MPTYKIKTSDTPEKISSQFGITVQDLYKENKGVYQYKTGQTVRIPKKWQLPTRFSPTGADRAPVRTGGGTTQFIPSYAGGGSTPSPTLGSGGFNTQQQQQQDLPENYDPYETTYNDPTHGSWSATMGTTLEYTTMDDWNAGYRPERMTVKNAQDLGIGDNWMMENGYVLCGDTWVMSATTTYYQTYYGSGPTPTPTQPTNAVQSGGTYTNQYAWNVGT